MLRNGSPKIMLPLFQIQILIKLNLVKYITVMNLKDIDLVMDSRIQPVEVVRNLPIDINSNGRVIVNQYHQVPTYRNVYVLVIVLIYHMRQVLS